jgi:hypothetical protein
MKFVLIGRLLALHDLWASGHISTTMWRAKALPVMRQLHYQEEES